MTTPMACIPYEDWLALAEMASAAEDYHEATGHSTDPAAVQCDSICEALARISSETMERIRRQSGKASLLRPADMNDADAGTRAD